MRRKNSITKGLDPTWKKGRRKALSKNEFLQMKPGEKLMIIDGLAGGTTTIIISAIHLEEGVIEYMGKDGSDSFALFEEVIKKL